MQGCPCTPQQVAEGHWKGGQPVFPDGKGILDSDSATFVSRPDNPDSPDVGWWYMIHGGIRLLVSPPPPSRGHPPTHPHIMLALAIEQKCTPCNTFCHFLPRKGMEVYTGGWKGGGGGQGGLVK